MNNNTKEFEDRAAAECFQRILSQTTNRPISLDANAEKLVERLAELFAEELVSKADDVAQRRVTEDRSIEKEDVEFVLKHRWTLYDPSAYFQTKKN